jgi:hypothetical protein
MFTGIVGHDNVSNGQSLLEKEIQGESYGSSRRFKEAFVPRCHAALFPSGPPKAKSIKELKGGIRQYVRKKYTEALMAVGRGRRPNCRHRARLARS